MPTTSIPGFDARGYDAPAFPGYRGSEADPRYAGIQGRHPGSVIGHLSTLD
ncbi:MAG: hypothetical protein NTX54_06810 [Chloroflexi bacterium]|nr:hypothetical protein [Chloroflexota bacterium]